MRAEITKMIRDRARAKTLLSATLASKEGRAYEPEDIIKVYEDNIETLKREALQIIEGIGLY